MAVPSNYRWVSVGSLLIRNRANAAANAPAFGIDDLHNALESRSTDISRYRSYAAGTRLMWCEELDDDGDFIHLLVESGDKNVSGVSFVHFAVPRQHQWHRFEVVI